jgi:hypothetical protein
MQIPIDNLLVALLVVLAPDQENAPSGEPVLGGLLTPDRQIERQQDLGATPDDLTACGAFADAEARRKCAIRTGRLTASGAVEPGAPFPEAVIWLAPAEPGMPRKLPPNFAR